MIRNCTLLSVSAMLTLVLTQNGQAVLIVASTTTPMPNVGDSVTVDLDLTGWVTTDAEVDSIQFNVNFDTSFLTWTSGTALTAGANTFIADNQQGGAMLADVSSNASVLSGVWQFGVTDNAALGGFQGAGPSVTNTRIDLGSVTFQAASAGTSSVTPAAIATFLTPLGSVISPTGGISFTGVSITVVPEPSAFLCLGVAATFSGLGLFFHWRRRLKNID